MSKNKELPLIVLKEKGDDGEEKEITLKIRKPLLADIKSAQREYNTTFRAAIEDGVFVRSRLDDFLKKQGLWSDEKQANYDQLREDVLKCEKQLATGGIKLSSAKEIALKMIKLRAEIRELVADRTAQDGNTAEGQADNAKFNYLVSTCLVYNDTNTPYFTDLEDYLNRSTSDAALRGAEQLGTLLYGLDSSYESKLPEFKFLQEYGFVDDKLRFTNGKGQLTDIDGLLVNEKGRYINEKNELVDKHGVRVDEEGEYMMDKQPFLDESDNPVTATVKEKTCPSGEKCETPEKCTEVCNKEKEATDSPVSEVVEEAVS